MISFIGERSDLLAIDVDVADQFVILEHRHEEKGSRTSKFDEADSGGIALLIGRLLGVIGNVNEALGSHRTPDGVLRVRIDQRVALSGVSKDGRRIMHSSNAEGLILA